MLTRSDPPVTIIIPLTVYGYLLALEAYRTFSNTKIQRNIGYHLKQPNMTGEVLVVQMEG